MTPKTILDAALKLPPEERMRLVEDIWNSLLATPDDVPVPDWHKRELNHLLDHPSSEPSISWEEARARLRRLK